MSDALPPRLLVLDDMKPVGATIVAFARHVGFEARAVTEPVDFFDLLGSWAPQVVVIDLVMPSMDGVEVIQELAGLGCKSRLIISSGVGSRVLDAARRAAGEHGLQIVGVLSKPFRAEDAKALLRSAMQAAPVSVRRAGRLDADPITEKDLLAALQEHQLRLVYQPKVETRTGRLRGFEALLRWKHPQRGAVSPDVFIPIAERTGLIIDITAWVFETGLEWLRQSFPDADVELAINVSAVNIDRADFVRRAVDLCRAKGLPTSRVTLELTETATMRDAASSLALFTQLRTQGFALAIDDFGTGYSSMVQLVRLPFSEMKIDRSFVMTALQNAESRMVVECSTRLGRGLGLCVVAEGVEDLAVVGLLDELGCDVVQGYAISRPLEADQVGDWLEQWRRQRDARSWP